MGSTRKPSWLQSSAARMAGAAALLRGRARPVILVALMAAGLLGGAFFVRHRWPQSLPAQALSASDLIVTPQPDWIHGDVKSDVLRDAQLTQFDVLDPQLTSRVADAFSAHTWVAEVRNVSKYAGPQVHVELVYRRPIAMVEVTAAGRAGLLPVDQHGVLLPPEDFSPNQARDYLRIAATDSKPAGPVGTPWGDPRVLGAARIAAAWNDYAAASNADSAPDGDAASNTAWKQAGLYRIEAEGPPPRPRPHLEASINYSLTTKEGRRMIWGRSPGEEASGEAAASQKIARLLAHVQSEGPLDKQPPGQIDLRDAQSLRVLPPTARRSP
ncbi:MAG: hypothetical protein RIC55_34165 [Pirellulaceae bacterium]